MLVLRPLLVSILTVAGVISDAQPQDAHSSVLSTMVSGDDALADFATLHRVLNNGHPALHQYRSQESLQTLYESILSGLSGPLTVQQLYRRMAPLVAATQCGHTILRPPADLAATIDTSLLLLPLLVWTSEGVPYVQKGLDDITSTLGGSRILSINGVPSHQFMQELRRATSADAGIASRIDNRLSGWRFLTAVAGILGFRSPYVLTVMDTTGRTRTLVTTGATLPILKLRNEQSPGYRPEDTLAVRLEFFDERRIAYLRLRRFWGSVSPGANETIGSRLKHVFQELRTRGSTSLILDVRDNGGGEDEMGAMLASLLMPRPFRYYRYQRTRDPKPAFDSLLSRPVRIPETMLQVKSDGWYYWSSTDPTFGVMQPATNHFSGSLFVLMNGGSFSTTAEMISVLYHAGRGTFIGEECGGGYRGDNGGWTADVVLPNSKIRLQLPLFAYEMAVADRGPEVRGVPPDYPVRYSICDVINNVDVELQIAIALARSNR